MSSNDFLDLSRYQIIDEIGSGPFSTVYRIENEDTGILYAAKTFKYVDEMDSQETYKFSRKVRIIQFLKHPSIISFIGWSPFNFEDYRSPTFVMELATNYTLSDIIKMEQSFTAPEEWDDTKKIITIYGIAAGMAYLHNAGIIHRDLKLENIFLDERFHPKISDYWLLDIDKLTPNSVKFQSHDELIKTIIYISPEILVDGDYSTASDVYAFAIIVYQIIVGQISFQNFSLYSLIEKVSIGRYRPIINENVPEAYRNLILRCWSQDPKDRPSFDQIVNELKNDLNFITPTVDVKEFLDYIDFIDNNQQTFEKSDRLLNFNDITEHLNRKYINGEEEEEATNDHKSSSINETSNDNDNNAIINETSTTTTIINENTFDISQYELKNEIGEGSFGKVFKVLHKASGVICAAKIAKEKLVEEEEDTAEILNLDLRREINNSYKINHPAIIKFIGFSLVDFEGKKRPVIIIEYANNGSLRSLMKKVRKGRAHPKWNDTKKLIILYGIASAMEYLHSHNIIHRDLKPDNILLDDDLNPKIADLGLSKTLHTKETMTTENSKSGFKGTPLYSPPEVFNDEKFTKSGDVYSFALVAYEVMTHDEPYLSSNFVSLITQLVRGKRPEFNSPIPKSYQILIESCWHQDPSKRPSFNEIVKKFKNEREFITDTIEESEFLNYMDYIEEYPISFKNNKIIPSFKEFCKTKIQEKEKVTEIESKERSQNKIKEKSQKERKVSFQNQNQNDHNAKELFETWEKMYFGRGVPVDRKGSLQYIKMAADAGHIESMYIYATMKAKGNGVSIDKNEALYYFKKAADEGYVESMYKYAMTLYRSNYHKVDDALIYLKKAADEGHVKAMFYYAKISSQIDKKVDQEELKHYYKIAADNGYVDAMLPLADLLSKEKKGQSEAAKYYKMSADNGNKEAMLIYAKILKKGIGVPANKNESKRYLLMAKQTPINNK